MKQRRINHNQFHLRHQSEEGMSSPVRTKQRQGAQSIQDRYLNDKVRHIKTQISLNQQDVHLAKENTIKMHTKRSFFPKIDVKYSLKNQKQLFFGKLPLTKRPHYAKRQCSELFGFKSFQIKQKNNHISITHEGNRIKNQDRISIQQFQICQTKYQYYAVFDGHGGHLAATYLANNLHIIIKSSLTQGNTPDIALKSSLANIQEKLKKNPRLAHKSGCCALVCLISQGQCWVANVGDSRMLSIDSSNKVTQITRDHKPQDQIQRKRIQYYGGQVYRHQTSNADLLAQQLPYRVFPSKLSVSRTIGDIFIKKANPNIISAQPDLHHFSTNGITYLLLFTDGLYEKFTNYQLSQFFLTQKLSPAASKLFESAFQKGSQDNRSLIAIQLK